MCTDLSAPNPWLYAATTNERCRQSEERGHEGQDRREVHQDARPWRGERDALEAWLDLGLRLGELRRSARIARVAQARTAGIAAIHRAFPGSVTTAVATGRVAPLLAVAVARA